MSTNNKVFQVLVTKGNAALPSRSATLDSLAVGQLGIFDAKTNLAIDGTTNPVRDFYLAVGVDKDGDTVMDGVNFSAGQLIQKENIRDFTYKPHSAARPMVFEITDYKVNCDTEYAVKLEFRNMQVYMRQGYNAYAKTFSVKTACCEECVDCPSGSPADLTTKLLQAFNSDAAGMFKAEAIEEPGGSVIADLAAYIADPLNAAALATLGIRITTVPLAIQQFCSINTMYYNPRQTVVIPSLIEGFNCTGKVTITQTALDEEGNGYDIKQKEYHAGGWNGKPGVYRASTALGLAMPGFSYLANEASKYDQFSLVYDQFSTAGWGEYLNNLMTLVAIPAADTVTRNSFATVMDAILGTTTLFEPLADDAAAASANPAVVETSPPTTGLVDGIA